MLAAAASAGLLLLPRLPRLLRRQQRLLLCLFAALSRDEAISLEEP
jgi:hypothetical protein